jgi:hypothetical protein
MAGYTVGRAQVGTIAATGSYDPVTIDTYGELDVVGQGVTVDLGTLSIDEGEVVVKNGATARIDSLGTVSFSGVNVGAGATIEQGPAVSDLLGVTFLTADGTFRIDDVGATMSNGFVTLFEPGDTIAVAGGITAETYAPATFGNEGILTLLNGGNTVATLDMNGTFTQDSFYVRPDGTLGVVCFAAGTRIATPAGPRAVETLGTGDRVRLAGGGQARIVWTGSRRIDCAAHPDPQAVWPVRIEAGALAHGLPMRDLRVSPDHALLIDGVLIAARRLLNGMTIVQEPVAVVTYHHVELARHAALLAEGVAAESFRDTGNRDWFDGASPARRCRSRVPCAPDADERAAEAIWHRLAARALADGRRLRVERRVALAPVLLQTGQGIASRAVPAGAGRLMFPLRDDAGPSLLLRSAAYRPTDRRPWSDDRRRLGLPVRRLRAIGPDGVRDIALDDPALGAGWHPPEGAADRAWRWTDGHAALRVPVATTVLEVTLVAG